MNKILKIMGYVVVSIIAVGGLIFSLISFTEVRKLDKDLAEVKDELKDLKKKNTSLDDNNNDIQYDVYENEDDGGEFSNLKLLTMDRFKKKIKNKESFMLVITQTTCGACLNYKPVLNDILKDENKIGFEIDLLKLDESEKKYIKELTGNQATPTTYFFVKGKVMDDYTILGNLGKETTIEKLKEAGFIK